MLPSLTDGVDTGGGGEVGGEVGAVLQGRPPTPGREGAAHSEPSGAHPSGDPASLLAIQEIIIDNHSLYPTTT